MGRRTKLKRGQRMRRGRVHRAHVSERKQPHKQRMSAARTGWDGKKRGHHAVVSSALCNLVARMSIAFSKGLNEVLRQSCGHSRYLAS